MNKVEIVKESKLGLELLGKIITHKTIGEGMVVGYSSITGQPFAYFYEHGSNEIICISNRDVISVAE